jgi:hypothetical protein
MNQFVYATSALFLLGGVDCKGHIEDEKCGVERVLADYRGCESLSCAESFRVSVAILFH